MAQAYRAIGTGCARPRARSTLQKEKRRGMKTEESVNSAPGLLLDEPRGEVGIQQTRVSHQGGNPPLPAPI